MRATYSAGTETKRQKMQSNIILSDQHLTMLKNSLDQLKDDFKLRALLLALQNPHVSGEGSDTDSEDPHIISVFTWLAKE